MYRAVPFTPELANCDKLMKVPLLDFSMSPTLSAPRRALKIPLTRAQWVILILLVLSVTINYIDRGSLSAADKYLQRISAWIRNGVARSTPRFFAGYAGLMLLAGWLVDRFDVNRVLAIGFMIWTTAILLTGAASGFAMLIVSSTGAGRR